MNVVSRIIPWCVVFVAGLLLLLLALPPREPSDKMQISQFGQLPVLDRGRFKPLDTYARVQLMVLSNRQTYRDGEGNSQPAIRWMLDTLAMGLASYYENFQFVHIDDPAMLRFLELKPTPRNLFPIQDIVNKPQFKQELQRVLHADRNKLNPFDKQLLALALDMARQAERLRDGRAIEENVAKRKTEDARIFRIENDQVLGILGLKPREGLRYSLSELRQARGFEQFENKAKEVSKRPEKEWDLVDAKTMELHNHLRAFVELHTLGGVYMVPPPSSAPEEDWQLLGRALAAGDMTGAANPNAAALERVVRAYGLGDVESFNKELAAYQEKMNEQYPEGSSLAWWETLFNHWAPFYWCTALYVVVVLIVLASWVVLAAFSSLPATECLNRTAFWLLALVFVAHSTALLLRMWLQGRPPVTNLYSSAIFIGWGAVGLGLLLECFFRLGVGSLIGAVLGFLTTLISHHLSLSGDTLEMMQAVLDTNFWLATHVVVVTLGYTATFVAGFLGIIYVVLGVGTPWLHQKLTDFAVPEAAGSGASDLAGFWMNRTIGKMLMQMLYGVICFATLLSFVGTVLGGIWADQSWGRFWGWDPKENGALLIVAMNALILHARWGGMIRDRGMAVLAMVGNMVTLWSWFGTNQLGIGLHAYGFNKTLVEVCRYGWILQGLLIAVALMPLRYWWSSGEGRPAKLNLPPPERAPRSKSRERRGSTAVTPAPV